jgi:osmotically-inducible protein OsmY
MTIERTHDAEIQKRVLRELEWDTRVDATDVGVEVHDGIVTLTGTVSSWAKRVAAQRAAHRVAGVRDVANDIAVNVPGSAVRTDTDIAHAVRRALEWHALVPDERIRTTVSEGRVCL